MIKPCKKHGETEHYKRSDGYYRCKKCSSESGNKRRKKLKASAVEYKGSVCFDCGLVSEYLSLFDFHHIDPTKKDFSLSVEGRSKSWDTVRKELDKCVMLCANCHRIRHEKGA